MTYPNYDVSQILLGKQTLAQAVGLTDDEVEKLYSVGHQYFTQGRYREAHPLLRLVAMCNHKSERYWMALAACRQMLGDFLLAAESYVTAAGLNLQNSTAAIQAVFCLLRAGEYQAAQTWLDEAERRTGTSGRETIAIGKCRALRIAISKATVAHV